MIIFMDDNICMTTGGDMKEAYAALWELPLIWLIISCKNETPLITLKVVSLLSLWTKLKCVTIQMKATEQIFQVELFVMLYKVVLTFKSVDETLVCDHFK